MRSALWHQTGGVWPMGISTSLTWYDVGAIVRVIQEYGIRSVVEIGVEHGGLAAFLLAYGRHTGLSYLGIDITLNALHPAVGRSCLSQRDAWSADAVADVGHWIATYPAPALIICDGGDKPRELKLYAPLLREGDILIGHDYHNEYVDDAIADVPARQVCTDWLDDTLLCVFVRGGG